MARPAIGFSAQKYKKRVSRPGRHKKSVKRKAPTFTSRFTK